MIVRDWEGEPDGKVLTDHFDKKHLLHLDAQKEIEAILTDEQKQRAEELEAEMRAFRNRF